MKRILAVTAAISLAVSPVMANPIQLNTGGGSPAQAQVYGKGSAASASQQQGQAQHQSQSVNTRSTATGGAGGAARSTATGGAGGAGGSARATGGTSRATGGASNVTVNNSASGTGSNGDNGGGYGRFPVSSAMPAAVVNGGCNSGGGSGVLQLPMVGIGGTLGGRQDIVCQSNEIGRPDVAFVYLCLSDKKYARASKFTAQPCPDEDAPRPPQPVAMHVVQDAPPDFCFTSSAGERRQHKECNGVIHE